MESLGKREAREKKSLRKRQQKPLLHQGCGEGLSQHRQPEQPDGLHCCSQVGLLCGSGSEEWTNEKTKPTGFFTCSLLAKVNRSQEPTRPCELQVTRSRPRPRCLK
jgi:hypothetical protein